MPTWGLGADWPRRRGPPDGDARPPWLQPTGCTLLAPAARRGGARPRWPMREAEGAGGGRGREGARSEGRRDARAGEPRACEEARRAAAGMLRLRDAREALRRCVWASGREAVCSAGQFLGWAKNC